MEIFSKIICRVAKVVTIGMVNANPETQTIVIKDPVTGVFDIIKQGVDEVFRDQSQGVWIGNRPIKGSMLGASSAVLRTFNMDIMHQAVMVDGTAYSLVNDKGSRIQIGEVSYAEKQEYEWRYRGKSKVSHFSMAKLIEIINSLCLTYNLVLANCQDVSDSLSKYALKIYNSYGCLEFVFPTIQNLPHSAILGLFTGIGGKAYSRLISDILTLFC